MCAPNTRITAQRRRFLRSVCVGAAGTTLVGTTVAEAESDDPAPSVTFDDQTSDGTSVVIARAAADVDALVVIETADGEWINTLHGRPELEPGEVVEDATVPLEAPITETQPLIAKLYESNGPRLDQDIATVTVDEGAPSSDEPASGDDEQGSPEYDGIDATLVDANPDAGFDSPYYLYAPERPVNAEPRPILVEPADPGDSIDERERRVTAAETTATDGTGRTIADELGAPLLVPAFPDSRLTLDAETLSHADADSGRVDLQLRRMLEDARARLINRGYPVADGLLLHGAGDAGRFVNRFTALHPEPVTAATVGGVDGLATLPIELGGGYQLKYPLGVADLEELTGEPFDLEAFREVDQFFYAGVRDRDDTLPEADAWSDATAAEFREIVRTVYGDDVRTERLPFCKAVYDDAGVDAVFRLYDDDRTSVVDDLVAFHERSLAGDDVADLRADLGGVPNLGARIDHVPPNPTAGEEISFTAARSAVWGRDLVDFEWRFDDGDPTTNVTDLEPETGERVAHAFETAGAYYVSLTVTDETGETHRAVELVSVDGESSGRIGDDSEDVAADDDAEADEAEAAAVGGEPGDRETGASETEYASASSGSGTDSVPGFGLGGPLAALGGLGYALRRRVGRTRERDRDRE